MATYIMLFRFTQQSIDNIKDSLARADAGKQAFRAMGAEVKKFYGVGSINSPSI